MIPYHELITGRLIFVSSTEKTSSTYGSNSEMRQMIGKYYPVLDRANDGKGVVLRHHSCGSRFTFRLEDVDLEPIMKIGKTKKINVVSDVKTKFDESLLII